MLRIARLVTVVLATLVVASPAGAAQHLRLDTGADAAGIQSGVDLFRNDLGGGLNPNTPGSAANGRREINWDGVPDALAVPAFLPPDFFNTTSPRGVVFSSGALNERFVVSQDDNTGADADDDLVRFSDAQASYATSFQTFSPQRLFAAVGTTVTDVNFFVPGSNTPATVRGFGVVLTDVDTPSVSGLELYDAGGALMTWSPVMTLDNGLSFIGISFDAGERIARARIVAGGAPLGAPDDIGNDVVAIDDFIYGEPQIPRLTINDVSVAEGGGNAVFTVTRDVVTGVSTTVAYGTTPDGADDGQDFTGTVGSVVFAPGDTTKQISVPILADTAIEGAEGFRVNLVGSPSFTFGDGDGDGTIDGIGQGTITDDDTAATQPRLAISDASVTEAPGGVTATLTVTRDVSTQGFISVSYGTVSGTAGEGSDFDGVVGSLLFSPGESSRTISVTALDDAIDEPAESFRVLLVPGDGFTLGDGEGAVTITDNDPPVAGGGGGGGGGGGAATPVPEKVKPVILVSGLKKKGCISRDTTITITIVEDNLASVTAKLNKKTLLSRARTAVARERIRLSIPARSIPARSIAARGLIVTAIDTYGNRATFRQKVRACKRKARAA
jgi:hypothetical protein